MYYTNINHYMNLNVPKDNNAGIPLLLIVFVLAGIINLLLMNV